jgi:phosphoribosylglycinamide formyltransferase-1
VGEQSDSVRTAVFGSGRGTTARALLDHERSGKALYRCVVVLSNRSDAGILDVAREFGVDARVLSPRDFDDREKYVTALLELLSAYDVEIVALAGYLLKVPAEVVSAYAGRIVNIHPALLPKFGGKGMYGINVHRAVLAAGERCTGMSVHLVDDNYDTGAILEQARVPIFATDTPETLMERVQTAERWYYPAALDRVCARIRAKNFWL